MKKPVAKRPAQPSNAPQNHTSISVRSHMWEAPIPPPQVLEDFNRVVNNGAERIIKAWETETEHRRAIEIREQRSFYFSANMGKVMAFVFVMAALGLSAFAIREGAQWAAAILGGGTIGAVVWAFTRTQGRQK